MSIHFSFRGFFGTPPKCRTPYAQKSMVPKRFSHFQDLPRLPDWLSRNYRWRHPTNHCPNDKNPGAHAAGDRQSQNVRQEADQIR